MPPDVLPGADLDAGETLIGGGSVRRQNAMLRSPMFRPSTRNASTALAALLLAGMAPAGAVDRVTFGQVSPTATLWPGVVAARKGFFAAAGVEMDVVSIGVSPGQQAVASGSLDIMHNACNAIVAYIEQGGTGAKLAMVSMAGHPAVLIGRKGLTDARDLKGKAIGTLVDQFRLDHPAQAAVEGEGPGRARLRPGGGPGQRADLSGSAGRRARCGLAGAAAILHGPPRPDIPCSAASRRSRRNSCSSVSPSTAPG